jgi:hypothetical protein
MLRTILAGLGAVFMLMLVFCASFLGKLAFDMHDKGPAYEKLAADITRDLARAWSVKDIREHYSESVADRLEDPSAQAPFNSLKTLGQLRYVDNMTLDTGWSRRGWLGIASPADAAERLAGVLRKSVTVTFSAKFANGFARVTMKLKNENGAMKLWHLQIDARDRLPRRPRKLQLISHA